MKRKLIAILCGLLTLLLLNLALSSFAVSNEIINSFKLTLALFISGGVTGYIAREKGWLFAGLTGIFIYPLFLFSFILFFIITSYQATHQINLYNMPSVIIQEINSEIKIYIFAFIDSALGGLLGQKLYQIRN